MAKANLSNAAMRTSQAAAIRQQIVQARSEISAAQAEVERARGKLKEVQADRADLQILAPIEGTVATRSAEPGEVVAAGTPLITLVNLNAVYLRGFIPEGQAVQTTLTTEPRLTASLINSASDPEPKVETALKVRGLSKWYGELEAVRGIDLDIKAGEIFGFIGPDGAGKTSGSRFWVALCNRHPGSQRT